MLLVSPVSSAMLFSTSKRIKTSFRNRYIRSEMSSYLCGELNNLNLYLEFSKFSPNVILGVFFFNWDGLKFFGKRGSLGSGVLENL